MIMDIRYKARIKTKNNRLYTISHTIYEVDSKKAMKKFGIYLLNYIPNAHMYYRNWISTYDGQTYYIELIKIEV
mgnify:CR=1 FL=1